LDAQEILLTDRHCVEFLQWALPQLALRWPGFHKVRGQVRKRIVRRLHELELTHIAEHRRYLADHPAEWTVLDACLRISISRFYRDRDVFDHLCDSVLPDLARAAQQRRENRVIAWSAGGASGEEPYTVALIWSDHVQRNSRN
jgi:chemotaxis protein methyltransferase CheR